MDCPLCQTSNPPAAARCAKCDTPLPVPGGVATLTETPPDLHGRTVVEQKTTPPEAPDRTIVDKAPSAMNVPTGWSAPGPQPADIIAASLASLQPGSVFGNRYEIVRQLGQGGMGAVYQARDRELDRVVAMKVIRPELATRPDILQRFKQELILARQVTHRNVIRIFDLGEAGGIKFITMEFIEGQDLKTLVAEKDRLSLEETVSILEQVCLALEAAHAEGVVHRDLKPQNIMVDKQGKVSVMDFGIARSIEFGGMTQTGALIGTPEYMSPEQVQGEKVDARSDLFTLGIIFYELLTGALPYQADTVMGTMIKRTKERARPPVQLNPQVPQFLSDVVAKCLEANPQKRYQSAREIYDDLKAWQAGAARRALHPVVRWLRYAPRYQKWVAASVIIFLLASGGYAMRQKLPFKLSLKSGANVEPVSLAILPFRNASGDAAIDWLGPSLAEMLRSDVGQSAYLRTVSADRLNQILHDLRVAPDSNVDPDTLRRIAGFTNAQTVVWGQYAKFGEQIRIDVTFQDLRRQRTVPLKVEAPNEKGLLAALAELAKSVQQNLALSSNAIQELQAKSFKPSSDSIQALRHYNDGLQLARQGKQLEAVKKFETATREDPDFALAYVKLGQTYASLGYDNEADKFSRKALDLSDKLPPHEKYLIMAAHARIVNDNQKAIEAYENLARVMPYDHDVQFALAGAYEAAGSLNQAREHYAKVLERDPKYVDALLAIGRVEIKAGNPQGGLEHLNRALPLTIQLGNEEEKAAVLQAIGVAYGRLGQSEEALRNYQESLEIKRRLGDKRGIGASLNQMAQVQKRLGKTEVALASYRDALKVRREIGDKKGIGDTLIDLGALYHDRGQHDEALKFFKESLQIQRELGDEANQALCLNNIGSSYFFKGQYEDALTYFQQALQLREKSKNLPQTALTLHNLGETNANMGFYDQALTQYLRAIELYRAAGDARGAAIESYSMGTLFQHQGRYGAALSSKQEALRTFQQLKDRSFWMAEILSGYGSALAEAGRDEEAQKSLDEAMNLARELKNDALVTQVLDFQGDTFFYRGDYKSARALYERALSLASRAKDRDKILLSKFNLSKVALKEGRSQAAISGLRGLTEEADRPGLKYLPVECSIYVAEALVNTKDYSRARQELELALTKSEKLGLRTLLAKGHYLLATALRLTGKGSEASGHYREALRLLEEISKESGASNVLQRADLHAIYTDSAQWSRGGKG